MPFPSPHFTLPCGFSYRQAQAAVLAVLPRLHQLQVPTKRPTDYFAEMAKSDQQMQKVSFSSGKPEVSPELHLFSWLVHVVLKRGEKGLYCL